MTNYQLQMSTFFLPGRVCSTQAIRDIAAQANTPYTFICLKPDIEWVYLGQERMIQLLEQTGATMVYADHFQKMTNEQSQIVNIEAPVIDYQLGALRDDFDFGAVLLWDTAKLKALVAEMDTDYSFAGLYDLRLRATESLTAKRSYSEAVLQSEGWSNSDSGQCIDLSVQYTMKAGHRDLRCDVTLSEAVEGLCTGVQTIPAKGGKDTVTIVLPNGVLLASWGTDWPVNDSAKYAKETVGLAVFIPKQFAGSLVHDKQNNLCLLKTIPINSQTNGHSPSNSQTGRQPSNFRCHFYLTCCGATKENHPVARTAEEWYAYLRKWAKGLK